MADAKRRKIAESNAGFFVDCRVWVRVSIDVSEWFPTNEWFPKNVVSEKRLW